MDYYKFKFRKPLITCSGVRTGQHLVVPGPVYMTVVHVVYMTPIPKAALDTYLGGNL